ncbi:MAG: hypothetical protein JXA21_27270 [Anaerolineae bacterium]|nr:hypothetical protein [Anaerolineae bacterium]
MPKVMIWALESDYDASTVKCLAQKLVTHYQLDASVHAVGKSAIPRRNNIDTIRKAVKNYLAEYTCVIFVIDHDGPMSSHQRLQEPNSLVNQVKRILEDKELAGYVYQAKAICEIESWLLIDCVGIFHYFAMACRRKEIDRKKIESKKEFRRLTDKYQKGDTEMIVEAEMGSKGAKEYLEKFSKDVILAINPNMPDKNVEQQKYREKLSPEIAFYIEVNDQTLRRNASFAWLGKLLCQCNNRQSKSTHTYSDSIE